MILNDPLVSIALCVFNGENFLSEQIESLLSQTYSNLEIIIIDDASSDQSYSIADSFTYDNRVKLFSNENNLGFSKNFEKCIQKCSGQYIALCDQDDVWKSEKILTLLEEIKDNILIYSDSLFIDENGNSLDIKLSDRAIFYKGSSNLGFIHQNCVCGHTILMRRDLVPFIIPFPQNVFHDWWIVFVATSIGSIDYTNQVLVYYRQHSMSQTDFLLLKQNQVPIDAKSIYSKIDYIKKIIQWLGVLKSFQYHSQHQKKIFQKLQYHYKNKLENYFSIGLFVLLALNTNTLFYFKKNKNFFSKINFAFQESIGIRARILLIKLKSTANSILSIKRI